MSPPSNGITPEVIRGVMRPYHLSQDLLHATFAAIPAPPPDATPAWRRARVTRLAAEIVAPMPANAEQARISAQLLIARELANTFAKAAQAPGLPIGFPELRQLLPSQQRRRPNPCGPGSLLVVSVREQCGYRLFHLAAEFCAVAPHLQSPAALERCNRTSPHVRPAQISCRIRLPVAGTRAMNVLTAVITAPGD